MNQPITLWQELAPKYWPIWLFILIARTLAMLPISWQVQLNKGLASLLGKIAASRTKTITKNIALAFPEKSQADREQLGKQNLQHSTMMLFDLINLIWKKPDTLQKYRSIQGEEHLKNALASGQPVLLVGSHMTSFMATLAHLSDVTPMHAVYRRWDNPVLQKRVVDVAQKRHALSLIHKSEISYMLKKLGSGASVFILPDQDFGTRRSVFIPFMGIQTATLTNIPDYANKTNARVLLVSSHRSDDFQTVYTQITEPLENYPSGDNTLDSKLWSDYLQALVTQYPDQYFWMHKRFKTHPENEGPRY